MGETVILLHGIMNHAVQMRSMAKHLSAEGYHVVNINYPSTRYSLEMLTPMISNEIKHRTDPENTLHFVGFSMGGLLCRSIVGLHRPKKLGRMVHLATPNQGSEIADFWCNHWLYKTLYGPAGQNLITDQSQIEHLFPPIDYELGIIAGNTHVAPISSLLFKEPHDGRVSVERTKVPGMKDHVVVAANHTFFPSFKIVKDYTVKFLRQGNFR